MLSFDCCNKHYTFEDRDISSIDCRYTSVGIVAVFGGLAIPNGTYALTNVVFIGQSYSDCPATLAVDGDSARLVVLRNFERED